MIGCEIWRVMPMRLSKLRTLAAVAVLGGSIAITGCYYEPAEGGPTVVADYGYEPMYYDGYLVYYDNVGRPFYWMNGVQVWVPPTSPYYAGYVTHWRTYGPAYRRWVAHYGTRYRTYRLRTRYYGGHRAYRRAPVRVHRHR
jgi:hypothetical protein